MPFGKEITRETVEDLERVRAVVDAYAPEELRKSLADDFGTTPPLPGTSGFEEYQVRVQRGLAEIVAATTAANAPKRRGRPPKTPEATSQDAGMDRPGGETAATD